MKELKRSELGAALRFESARLVLGTALFFIAAGSLWSHLALGPLALQLPVVGLWSVMHACGFLALAWPRLERPLTALTLAAMQLYFHTIFFRYGSPFLPTAPVFFLVSALSLGAYSSGRLWQPLALLPLGWAGATLWLRSTYNAQEEFRIDIAMRVAMAASVVFTLGFLFASKRLSNRIAQMVEHLGARKGLQGQRLHAARLQQLGQMSACVLHEINNPLVSINGYVHQIREELAEAEPNLELIEQATERIHFNGTRVMELSRALRGFTRESSRDPQEGILVRELLEDATKLTEFQLRTRRIELKREFANNVDPMVWGDRVQLGQILVNLISNAMDACAQSAERVVKLGYSVNNGRVRLWVEDSGHGIPDDVADKIFTPYFTTKSAGNGTGLGLSLSRQIAENHGGELNFSVRRDAPTGRVLGTVFTLDLPRHEGGVRGSSGRHGAAA